MLPNLSYAERMQRAANKRAQLLAFLGAGEVFTSLSIAEKILGLSGRRAATCLQGLERDKCIKSEVHQVGGRQLKIYGITPHGLAVAGRFDAPAFELGRTNASWIMHRIETQRMRLAAEAAGWQGWQPERALRADGLKKVPDAIGISPSGERIAIEIERHCKTPKRYQEIIVAYLQEIKIGKYAAVHFVSPRGVSNLVRNAFGKIDAVKFQGEVVQLEAKHLSRFKFIEFNNWPPAAAEKEE